MAYSPPSPRISASSIGATFLMQRPRPLSLFQQHRASIGSIARPWIIEEARPNAKSRRTRLAPVRGAACVLELVAQVIGRRAHVD
ncbi:hypothetical protein NEOLEDRAFT_1175694 [Neolentinus lepideus HHB14362 ss-1]|uniref:Uncharacterized protein n=1 Tax=Neolentinus lepideus HHB14362 ss-1 TaxID=1314782 RepID=A0A165UYE3_9AGAM|nr:hypothetical protein NEOLEDRAFT_1175694 [Neolentinus lepideus HHB14362 ss-1]